MTAALELCRMMTAIAMARISELNEAGGKEALAAVAVAVVLLLCPS